MVQARTALKTISLQSPWRNHTDLDQVSLGCLLRSLKDFKGHDSPTVEHLELERRDIQYRANPAISVGLRRSLPIDDP